MSADKTVDTDGDDIDRIQSKILGGMAETLSMRNAVQLGHINDALLKIEGGSFGICEECEEDIPPKRLKARPEATTCINCAEKLEQLSKQYATG